MAPEDIRNIVFDLVVLVDTGLRPIVSAADGEVAGYIELRKGCRTRILRHDLEAGRRWKFGALGKARLIVEAGPVKAQVVHDGGAERVDVVQRVLLDVLIVA